MELLKDYQEVITLIFSGVVAISTAIYVILTSSLVSESRKIRKAQIEPQIIPYFVIGEVEVNLLYLIIRNIGLGTAYNIKFEILNDFQFEKEPKFKLTKCGILLNGSKYFPPNMSHKYYIGSLLTNPEEKLISEVSLKVHYYDILGTKKTEIYELNLTEFKGICRIDPPDSEIGQISYMLKQINKTIEKSVGKNETR